MHTSLRFPLLDPLGLSDDHFFHTPFAHASHGSEDEIYKVTYLRFRDLSVRALELSALMRAAFFLFLFFTLAFV